MFTDLEGPTMPEYALIAALIIVVAAIAFTDLGKDVKKAVEDVGSKFQ